MVSDPITIDGPWQHKTVHAHGARFHVAVQGSGPLVLLVHGFPTYWWLWRDIMGPLADAGYTVAAMDMRGYGATDHPPRGYDPRTLAADCAGVVRAMGFDKAVVIGHGVGGLIAWTAATLQKQAVRAAGAIGGAHPNALRTAMLTDPRQTLALSYVVGFQRPFLAERSLRRDNAQAVADLLTRWYPGISKDVVDHYRAAFQVGNTAHCSIEFHRWAMRSIPRLDGRSFAVDLADGVHVPMLSIHGTSDSSILPSTARASSTFAHAGYTDHELDAGHLLPEECPHEVASLLIAWLGSLPRD